MLSLYKLNPEKKLKVTTFRRLTYDTVRASARHDLDDNTSQRPTPSAQPTAPSSQPLLTAGQLRLELLLLLLDGLDLLVLHRLDLLVQVLDVVLGQVLSLLPRGVLALARGQHAAHGVLPRVALALKALGLLLGVLGLDAQHQLEVVVRVALRLLVEVLARLHGAHDGLDVRGVADDDGHGPPAAVHDGRELPQGVRLRRGAVGLHGQLAQQLGAEAAAAGAELVQPALEALVGARVLGVDVGEVKGRLVVEVGGRRELVARAPPRLGRQLVLAPLVGAAALVVRLARGGLLGLLAVLLGA